jgi:hypothetical protein
MSEFRLTVSASDKTAEITVLDARQNPILTRLGSVDERLPAGLYELRVRLGPAILEKLISLSRDQSLAISEDDFQFPTPVPLVNTARTRDYHQKAAVEASRMTPVDHGSGATILVFARDWSPDENTTGNPLRGLTLHDAVGTQLVDLTEGADFRQTGDVSAGNLVSVNPGAYRLRLTLADAKAPKPMFERMIVAVAGWQTQIFMFRQDQDGERRADLAGGAVVMARENRAPERMFDPAGKGERVAVLARYALVQRRPVADAVYQELFDLKFDDPVLGLLAAHLLLRDKPDQRDFLDEVMTNLRKMLGPDHPDVLALDLRALATVPADTVLRTLPMLRASWDIVTAASVARPELIPDGDLFNSVQSAIEPSLPWLTWQVHDGAELAESSSFGFQLPEYRLEALKAFLVAHGKSAASRSMSGGSASFIPEVTVNREIASNAIIRSTVGGGSGETDPQGFIHLADNVKVELTRSLGVSGGRLEAMLNRAWDETSKIG